MKMKLDCKDGRTMNISHIMFNCTAHDAVELTDDLRGRVMVVKSAARLSAGGVQREVFPDAVAVFPPGATAVIEGSAGRPLLYDGFAFDGPVPEAAKEYTYTDNIPASAMTAIIRTMKGEDFEDRPCRDAILDHYAGIFFLMLERAAKEKKTRRKQHYFYKLREDIFNQPYRNWKIDDIVAESGLSKRQFYHSYRAVFHSSPRQDILSSRIDYAKFLLTGTEMRAKEIAVQCGFSSDQHFIQTFHARVGVSPSRFRYDFVRFKKTIRDDAPVDPGYLYYYARKSGGEDSDRGNATGEE